MSPLNKNYETGMRSGSRRRPKLVAALSVIVVVVAGALALVLTQTSSTSSAQTASKATGTPSSSTANGSTPQSPTTQTQSVSPVEAKSRGTFGTVLVTASGATLYRYTPDKPNMPTCMGSCAMAWPPDLLPTGSTSTPPAGLTGLGSVMLPDGRRQLTYNRTPLYTFADDHGTSVNGQGIGGVWFVVHPSSSIHTATRTTAPVTPPASSSSGGGYGY
jgi:predicted lipoprotein with Yx(FWY)xxD motif